MNYFVYVNELIGVETPLNFFKWNFGTFTPRSTNHEFSKCLIKIKLNVCKDKDVFKKGKEDQTQGSFRHFSVYDDEIIFRQKIGLITFGYRMSIANNTIEVTVGRNYYRWVKYKVMNVYPIWYVLYDAVCCLLLKNGLAVLYGSAVETELNKATVFIGAPGVGKTVTATTLCKTNKLRMIAEDLLITDGQKAWPVPYTNTYRGNSNRGGITFANDVAKIKRIVILEQGHRSESAARASIQEKIRLLNRYNVPYYSSPAMIAYTYFNPDYSLDYLFKTEEKIFENMLATTEGYCLNSDDSMSFAQKYLEKEKAER